MVVDSERALLEHHGIRVTVYFQKSDKIRSQGFLGAIRTAPLVPWNHKAYKQIQRLVQSSRFDVLHLHNSFPMISPSVLYAARGSSARVLTLHNYRLFCPGGIPLRNGVACTECIESHSVIPALKYGCYRNSRVATLPIALSVALHRGLGTWLNEVDAFIVLSQFQRDLMVRAGLPAHKVFIKNNFVADSISVSPSEKRSPYVVYVGRLGPEKGLRTLIRAWRLWGSNAPRLHIVGSGPIRTDLEIESSDLNIKFFGSLSAVEVQSQLANARLLVHPSECLETSSLAVMESFSNGTPAAVSAIGPLPSLLGQGGVTFPPCDPEALLDVVSVLWNSPSKLRYLSQEARNTYNLRYSAQQNIKELLYIYEAARSNRSDLGSTR